MLFLTFALPLQKKDKKGTKKDSQHQVGEVE